MADSPLNNSWPSFSKLWMKRWSFKRASDCKPCVQPCGSPRVHLDVQPYAAGDAGSSSSLAPASVAEDIFFGSSSPDDEETSSVLSDYDCPCAELSDGVEDLPGLGPPADLEDFPDLEEAWKSPGESPNPDPEQGTDPRPHRYEVPQLSPGPAAECVFYRGERSDPWGGLDLTIDLDGLLITMDTITGSEEGTERCGVDGHADVDTDSFPILVRSMSTSRRHSWGVPVSPLTLGRRLSLDTAAMDSDGEREDEDEDEDEQPSAVFQPGQRPTDEVDGPGLRGPRSRDPHSAPDDGKRLSSETLADDGSRAALISRMVHTSKLVARATGAEVGGPEESLQGQSHMLMVQKVLQELRLYHGAERRNRRSGSTEAGSVTWYEFLSNQNEDEAERAEKVEKGTKVRRTLSSLRSRMTGSFHKDKGKNRQKGSHRGRAAKGPGGPGGPGGGSSHRLVPGSFSSCATCSLCSKALQKKHGLQCTNCAVNVHKSCKSLLGECTSSRNKRDLPPRSGSSPSPAVALQSQDREQEQDPGLSQALDGHPGFSSSPGMTIGPPRGSSTHPHSSSAPTALHPSLSSTLCHHSSSGSLPGEMDETDALRSRRCADDAVSLAPSTSDSIIVEDSQFATLRADLECDAQDLEAESWSLAVDQEHLKKLCKSAVKRQDVIYELMQTEMHHVRTLKIMLHVYARELRENLQMDPGRLECLFPRLENLLELHAHFLSRLKERQRESLSSPSDRNYTIHRVADILMEQFSGEIGEKMRDCYGDFCSHHAEAVSYYKEQKQNNKKFHNIIRKLNNLPIVRRLGVTECILLVTQRITKYPVLVERLLSNTQAESEEHQELSQSLSLIRETILQVDAQVNVQEKISRLRDIHAKMEPKALGKFKDGRVFRREDLAPGRRRLLHDGTVSWKAASGRLKDILAVLLSDVLLLLQDKDQRYVFASVDNKPSVISLQKLIVREVAQSEKAMFLICASSNEPEMYKIHTSSKEERNAWMGHIRQAAESCPHTEERLVSEEEEARAYRLNQFQEQLGQKDAAIARALSEKLQLFADLAESVIGPEDAASRSRLLLRGDTPDLQQGEALLKGAITDVENLQNLLQSGVKEEDAAPRQEDGSGSGHLPRRAVTFGGYDSSPAILNGSVKKNLSGESRSRDRSQRASSDPQLKELCGSHTLEQTVDESSCSPARWARAPSSFPQAEIFDRVLVLSQKLYSLQAVVSQWDSHVELQRASLPGRHRGNGLLEQEKQRTLALQREELASFHKMAAQHRQEQQRWERERDRHRQQAEASEARLHQREEECRRLEEQLDEERKELESQRETYQQDLERLRESTRAVEKEKERLEHQKKLKRKTIEVAPMCGSLNGELLASSSTLASSASSDLPPRPLVRSSLSVAPADYPERPEVLLRREASSSGLALKTEVPLHLFSTTNQLHKPVGVQQQIPTKLAALSSGKGKSGKSSRASQRSDSSASGDMRQMLPMKLSAPGDTSLKARRSVSPNQQLSLPAPLPPPSLHPHTDHFSTPEVAAGDAHPSHPPSLHKPPMAPVQPHPHPSAHSPPPSQSGGSLLYQTQGPGPSPPAHAHGPPPPYKINPEELSKEDVIFF